MKNEFGKIMFGSWYGLIKPILSTKYFKELIKRLNFLYKTKVVWPKKKDVFRVFKLTEYKDLKIVILGMDPYPNNKANGLAFSNSLNSGSISPSLRKIIEVIEDDYYKGLNLNFDSTLESWSKQGVLLLNTSLTVESGKSGSHINYWNEFIEFLFKQLKLYNPGIIYVLWGKHAKSYKKYIDLYNNYIIEAEHPAASIYSGRKWNFSFKEIDEITTKLYGENIKW